MRLRLLTSIGAGTCAVTTLLPGALGNPELLKKQVKVKVGSSGLQDCSRWTQNMMQTQAYVPFPGYHSALTSLCLAL